MIILNNIKLLIALSALVLITACGGGGGGGSSTDSLSTALQVASIDDVTMNCDDSYPKSVIYAGDYAVENNTWGKDRLTNSFAYRQCAGIGILPNTNIVAKYNWDWGPYNVSGVKSYPATRYGWKPGQARSNKKFPIKFTELKNFSLDFDIEYSSATAGDYQTLIDLWITTTDTPSQWAIPPIKTEVMINVNKNIIGYTYTSCTNGVTNSNFTEGRDGQAIQFKIGDAGWMASWNDYPNTWRRVEVHPACPVFKLDNFDLKLILNKVKETGGIQDSDYISSIELGTEVYWGSGAAKVNKFKVNAE
jgi:hypothetical protein